MLLQLTAILLYYTSLVSGQQQCSYVTVPVCGDDVTVTPGSLISGRGEKGVAGPPGKMGPRGFTGQKGDIGAVGLKGDVGPPGEVGLRGLPGLKGDQGTVGQKGAVGLTGAAGSSGESGQQGPIGPTGYKGDVGPPGEVGLRGLSGIKGDKGDVGQKGAVGLTGAAGSSGESGQQGPIGPTGYKGDVGPPGEVGLRGLSGIKGDKGDVGQKGAVGLTGAAGSSGESGEQGPVGPKGDKGAVGQKGEALDLEDFKREMRERFRDIDNRLLPVSCLTSSLNGYQRLRNNKTGVCDDKWTVFQRRFDGSVDFHRNWQEYKDGFGNMEGEFWLGLDQINRMTSGQNCKLKVKMTGFDAAAAYAQYSSFAIDDESDNYRLHVSGFSGTAGDSLDLSNGMQFTTKDRDNDGWSWGNCALQYDRARGGWWYNRCGYSGLNSEWGRSEGHNYNMIWYHWKGWGEAIKESTMMFKCE